MDARLERGAVIDGYTLEERIHQGSMATLWRVSTPGQPPLVMKMPLLREGDDPTAMVGFEVEQMIMPILQGPHVPLFIASGDFSAQPYIVMEHIGGASLRARLERTPLDSEEVARIGALIATALHSLHRQHVIHLDLKPSNVMFRDTGEAVLIDFGFSRHDRLPDLLAEQFRLPMGTAPYISPEQVLRIRNDPRSDIFALGAVLYHLITGERAFGFPTSITGLRKRLYRDPVPPRARNPSCPAWLQEIILRCLEPDPTPEVPERGAGAPRPPQPRGRAADRARPEGAAGRPGDRHSPLGAHARAPRESPGSRRRSRSPAPRWWWSPWTCWRAPRRCWPASAPPASGC